MHEHEIIQKLLEIVFSAGSVTRLYRRDQQKRILALRVVGVDEKEIKCLGYNLATLFLGDINTGI
jgi:hypothetical protein